MKDHSKIIEEFKKLPYEGSVWKSPKHESTDGYFYLSRQLAKWIMRADALNLYVDPVRTEMNDTQ